MADQPGVATELEKLAAEMRAAGELLDAGSVAADVDPTGWADRLDAARSAGPRSTPDEDDLRPLEARALYQAVEFVRKNKSVPANHVLLDAQEKLRRRLLTWGEEVASDG